MIKINTGGWSIGLFIHDDGIKLTENMNEWRLLDTLGRKVVYYRNYRLTQCNNCHWIAVL